MTRIAKSSFVRFGLILPFILSACLIAGLNLACKKSSAPPASTVTGASFKAFHGPMKFTGSLVLASYVPFEDYGTLPTSLNERDTFSFTYPNGYIVDQDCHIIGTDVTAAGVSIASSISSAFGSGSANSELTVSSNGKLVTITGTATAAASAIGPYIGNGNTVGLIEFGYPSGNNVHDLALAIDNPSGEAFLLRFNWTYSGSETSVEDAGWKQYFTYQVDPHVCASNGAVESLFQVNDFSGNPPSGSGSHSITLSGEYHLISIGLQSEASGGWWMDHLERGNYGSAESEATVTIEIVP